jgi:hypothetical protein
VHAESKKLKVKKSLVFMFTITCKKWDLNSICVLWC